MLDIINIIFIILALLGLLSAILGLQRTLKEHGSRLKIAERELREVRSLRWNDLTKADRDRLTGGVQP